MAIVDDTEIQDGWKYRRWLLFLTTGFYKIVIAFCLFHSDQGELYRSALSFSFLALSTNVGIYVFGSTWENISMAKQGFVNQRSSYQPQTTGTDNAQPFK